MKANRPSVFDEHEEGTVQLPHPRRPGSPCQRYVTSNAESYRAHYGALAPTRSGYREKAGWEDAVYVEDGQDPLFCVVRVASHEIICFRGHIRDMPHG